MFKEKSLLSIETEFLLAFKILFNNGFRTVIAEKL